MSDPSARLRRYVLHGIRLAATRGKARIGASKLGGLPDLPAGVAWPSVVREGNGKRVTFSLAFVAQIALADVARFDREKLLPKSGLLSFFVLDLVRVYDAIGTIKRGKTSLVPEGATRVMCFDAKAKLARRAAPGDLPESHRSNERKLRFASVETWPQVEGTIIGARGEGKVVLNATEWGAWAESAEKPPRLGMLGHPYGCEFPIGEDPNERLLLSVDAKESGLPWDLFGRNGFLYVHAPEKSLRARRWEEARHKEW